MANSPPHKRRWLLLLLGLTLVRGAIYALFVPPWQSPDEPGHFEYAWSLAQPEIRSLKPAPDPRLEGELLASLYEWRFGAVGGRVLPDPMPTRMDDLPKPIVARRARTLITQRFSLSYLWYALFLRPVRGQDLLVQLYVTRLASVLLNVLISWLAFLTLAELLKDRQDLLALAGTLVVMIPQHTFINSAVGDGTLAELLASVVLYCWLSICSRGARVANVAGVIAGTALGMWTKTTAAFLLPMNAVLTLWLLLRGRRRAWNARTIVALVLGIALIGALLGLWSGSSLGKRVLFTLRTFPSPSGWAWRDARGLALDEGLLLSYESFWANFGWMSLPVDARWYGAILLLSALALIGWFVRDRSAQRPPHVLSVAMALTTAVAVYVWVALLSKQSEYYSFQGRYLFPVLIPFSFFFVRGLDRLFDGARNRAWRIVIVLFLIALDTASLAQYIVPHFYA